jgi:septal ring factor EnvC (AmiA/AmiB activator)
MQRIIIAVLALGLAAVSTLAIYLRSEVVERDDQIAHIERSTTEVHKETEQAAAQAAAAKAALTEAREEIHRLKTELESRAKTPENTVNRSAAR